MAVSQVLTQNFGTACPDFFFGRDVASYVEYQNLSTCLNDSQLWCVIDYSWIMQVMLYNRYLVELL